MCETGAPEGIGEFTGPAQAWKEDPALLAVSALMDAHYEANLHTDKHRSKS